MVFFAAASQQLCSTAHFLLVAPTNFQLSNSQNNIKLWLQKIYKPSIKPTFSAGWLASCYGEGWCSDR
jgi:hypothetical protein